MSTDNRIPNVDLIKESILYEAHTGTFTWRHRPRHHFKSDRACAVFNSRFAGKQAGTVSDQGYLIINFGGVLLRAHRIAWLLTHGSWPRADIDHLNHIRFDNRISNLRDTSRKSNQRNQKLRSTNLSGHTGIHWRNDCQKWRAMIMVDGRSKHIGYFDDLDAAVQARSAANDKNGFHQNHGAAL